MSGNWDMATAAAPIQDEADLSNPAGAKSFLDVTGRRSTLHDPSFRTSAEQERLRTFALP